MMEWLQTAKDKKKVQQTLDEHLADYTGKRDPTPYRCNFCHDYKLSKAALMSHSVVCSVKHHHKARKEIDLDKINSIKDYGPAHVPYLKVSNRGWALQDFAVDALALPLVAPEDVDDDERLLEVEEEEESVDAVAFEPSGTHRRLTQAQKIMALDHYKEGGRAISPKHWRHSARRLLSGRGIAGVLLGI
jgi:hypothetical protein